MSRRDSIRYEFVEYVPDTLEEGVLYVSVSFATASHKCACGCDSEVVTPLSRTDWRLTYDGESVSLYPSIGNWSLPCQSHYWIEQNRVRWAPQWSRSEIDAGRRADRRAKAEHFSPLPTAPDRKEPQPAKPSLWRRIKRLWS